MAFVRVKGPDGSEFTIDEGAVKALEVSVLKDKDAVDVNGQPLPAKYPTNLAGEPKASAKQKEA
jgi:hypothetical protein